MFIETHPVFIQAHNVKSVDKHSLACNQQVFASMFFVIGVDCESSQYVFQLVPTLLEW